MKRPYQGAVQSYSCLRKYLTEAFGKTISTSGCLLCLFLNKSPIAGNHPQPTSQLCAMQPFKYSLCSKVSKLGCFQQDTNRCSVRKKISLHSRLSLRQAGKTNLNRFLNYRISLEYLASPPKRGII